MIRVFVEKFWQYQEIEADFPNLLYTSLYIQYTFHYFPNDARFHWWNLQKFTKS